MEQLFTIVLYNGQPLHKLSNKITSLDDIVIGGEASTFTADEIDMIDVRLWVFAEPVDGTPIYKVPQYQDKLNTLKLGE